MNVLVTHGSPRGAQSTSRALGELFAGALRGAHVRRHDLASAPPPHVDGAWVRAEGREPEARDDADREALRTSDALVDDVLWADVIVVTTPMYNFSVPSGLKAWLDAVTRAGRTFAFGPSGPRGLLEGRRAVVIATFGMGYADAPMRAMDFVEPMLRASLGWLGLAPLDVIRVEGQLLLPEPERSEQRARAEQRLVELAASLARE